jgi:hypothetical protein
VSNFWYNKKKVKCPYYVGEKEFCILCEGSLSKKVQWIFENAETKKAYKHKYCEVEQSSCMHKICLTAMKGRKDG